MLQLEIWLMTYVFIVKISLSKCREISFVRMKCEILYCRLLAGRNMCMYNESVIVWQNHKLHAVRPKAKDAQCDRLGPVQNLILSSVIEFYWRGLQMPLYVAVVCQRMKGDITWTWHFWVMQLCKCRWWMIMGLSVSAVHHSLCSNVWFVGNCYKMEMSAAATG